MQKVRRPVTGSGFPEFQIGQTNVFDLNPISEADRSLNSRVLYHSYVELRSPPYGFLDNIWPSVVTPRP